MSLTLRTSEGLLHSFPDGPQGGGWGVWMHVVGPYFMRTGPDLEGVHETSFNTVCGVLEDMADKLRIPALLQLCRPEPANCLLALWDDAVRLVRDVRAGHMAADAESPYAQLMINVVPLIKAYLAFASLGSAALAEHGYRDTIGILDQVPLAERSPGFLTFRASLATLLEQAVLIKAVAMRSQGGIDVRPVMRVAMRLGLPEPVEELAESVITNPSFCSVGSVLGKASSAWCLVEGPLELLGHVAPRVCAAAGQMVDAFHVQGIGILSLGSVVPLDLHAAIRQALANLRRAKDAISVCQGASRYVSKLWLGALQVDGQRVLSQVASVPGVLDPDHSGVTFAGSEVLQLYTDQMGEDAERFKIMRAAQLSLMKGSSEMDRLLRRIAESRPEEFTRLDKMLRPLLGAIDGRVDRIQPEDAGEIMGVVEDVGYLRDHLTLMDADPEALWGENMEAEIAAVMQRLTIQLRGSPPRITRGVPKTSAPASQPAAAPVPLLISAPEVPVAPAAAPAAPALLSRVLVMQQQRQGGSVALAQGAVPQAMDGAVPCPTAAVGAPSAVQAASGRQVVNSRQPASTREAAQATGWAAGVQQRGAAQSRLPPRQRPQAQQLPGALPQTREQPATRLPGLQQEQIPQLRQPATRLPGPQQEQAAAKEKKRGRESQAQQPAAAKTGNAAEQGPGVKRRRGGGAGGSGGNGGQPGPGWVN